MTSRFRTPGCGVVRLLIPFSLLFVGPYAPAILRFRITFPTSFPDQVPLITFTTDIFHPLVTPLTIRTHTTLSSLDGESSSGVDDDRMPPGGFNLRAGFPAHSKASSTWGDSTSKATPKLTVYEVLCYVRAAFEDEALLNDLPPEAAGDPGAWQAWQTHRRRTKTTVSRIGDGEDDTSPALSEESDDEREVSTLAGPRPSATLPARPRRPEEWNWEGVWETRVRKGIEGSLAEPVLYGQVVGDESIQFLNLDAEAIETIKENMKRSLRSTGS